MNHTSRRTILLASLLFAAAGSLSACAGTDADGRTLTRDDAGNVDTTDAGDLADVADANNADSDAGETADAGDSPDANNSGFCQPNFDGRIDRSEVTLRSGLSAKFMVGLDATVDLEGTEANGARAWDLAGDLEGDSLELIELRDPNDFWFGATFPTATYVAKLSAREDLLGVFQATDDALLLLGVASPDEGFFETELEYDPPVEVLKFPLSADSQWSGEHEVSGLAQGTPVFYTEDYSSEVWAEGSLEIPFGSFEVQSVRVELTRTIGLLETSIRTYAFVSECFGTVATVTSQDDEPEIFFTEAAEARRLAP